MTPTFHTVRQHIPGCVDADSKEAQVSSVEELLALPWVKSWEEERDPTYGPPKEFFRWAHSEDRGGFPPAKWWQLIAELRGGAEWWVVAHVPAAMSTGTLPTWDSVRAMELKAQAESEMRQRIHDIVRGK